MILTVKKNLSIVIIVSLIISSLALISVNAAIEWLAGDTNSDGAVNMKDIVLLQQYLNKWDVTIDESVTDVNEDSAINMKDIVLLQQFLNNSATLPSVPKISYKAHVEDDGWMSLVKNGETAGTTGENKRLEAIVINHPNVQYRVHIQDAGWLSWVSSGDIAGTTGENKQIEAVQIKPDDKFKCDVYYRLHIENYGWTGWAKNGETAGSTGIGLRAEAIQIKIVKKGETVESDRIVYLKKPEMTYTAHIQDLNWLDTVNDGEIIGTTGQSLRLEAFKIHLKNFEGNNGIYYKAHVSDIGWQDWVSSGSVAGTEGQEKPVEAIQIKLSSSLVDYFDIYYRVHSQDYDWLGWAKNGESAGTIGGRKQIEAMQIKLVPKGDEAPGGGTPFYELEEEVKPSNIDFVYPMQNTYVCGNDWREYYSARPSRPYHAGIDIASSVGNTNIYATTSGTVDRCGWNSANGNYVVIKHSINGSTVYSFYAHLSSYCVSVGTSVDSSTKIGVMGNTGSGSAGAHLHFAFVDTSCAGNYYGYIPYFTGDKSTYGGVTFYNPHYIVQNNQLP